MFLLNFLTSSDCEPFSDWFRNLKDTSAQARILTRLNRIETDDYFGDSEALGGGLHEIIPSPITWLKI